MKSARDATASTDDGAMSVNRRRQADPPAEPIAIVGMACRFPQAPNLTEFWHLLEEGESAVIQGVPGSGVGRIGQLFPEAAVQNEACLFGGVS